MPTAKTRSATDSSGASRGSGSPTPADPFDDTSLRARSRTVQVVPSGSSQPIDVEIRQVVVVFDATKNKVSNVSASVPNLAAVPFNEHFIASGLLKRWPGRTALVVACVEPLTEFADGLAALAGRFDPGVVAPLVGGETFVATVIPERLALSGRISVTDWVQTYAVRLAEWIVEFEKPGRGSGTKGQFLRDRAAAERPWEELRQPLLNPTLASMIDAMHLRFEQFRKERLDELQAKLNALTDPANPVRFRDAAEKQLFASRLQDLLNKLGLRCACPKCDQPAAIRGGVFGDYANGAFRFEHSVKGRSRSHKTLPELPQLKLVPAPDRNFIPNKD